MALEQNTPQLRRIHRNASNGVTLISQTPNIINEENVTIATGREKKTVSILRDGSVKSTRFHILFLRVDLAIMLLDIFQ